LGEDPVIPGTFHPPESEKDYEEAREFLEEDK
jgi:hypothetical protein